MAGAFWLAKRIALLGATGWFIDAGLIRTHPDAEASQHQWIFSSRSFSDIANEFQCLESACPTGSASRISHI